MTTYKRIDGSYVVTTINPGETITLAADQVIISGNLVTAGGLSTIQNLSVAGNGFIAGDLTVGGNLTATGNIAGDRISYGNTVVEIPELNGNVAFTIHGASNVAVISDSGLAINGNISLTGGFALPGNIVAGNLIANATVSGIDGNFSANVNGVTGTFTNLAGTLTTAAQPNVTSVGTLNSLSVTGNIAAGNISIATIVANTITSKPNGPNLAIGSNVVVTGNVIANYFSGDGSLLTNITAISNVAVSQVANGASIFGITGPGGDIFATVSGFANVVVINPFAMGVAGNINAVGNINGNYFIGNGSQLTGVQSDQTQVFNGTSNVSIPVASGNIEMYISGQSIANISGSGVNVKGALGVTGNVTAANLVTAGNLSAGYVFGDGSQLTGISLATINNGTSNVAVVANANVSISVSGTPNVAVFTSTGANIAGTLNATGNANVGNLGTVGNITAGYFLGNGSQLTGIDATAIQNGTSNVRTFASANVTISAAGTANVFTVTSTGANIAGNLSVGTGTISVGSIVNSNANGVGNIGTSSTYFDTIFARATSALYADLAEIYQADQEYVPGTVVVFGGEKEITVTTTRADARVAGAISTNPAYLMNSQGSGLALALRGKIPVRVTGPVNKGDSLVTSDKAGFAESIGTDRTYGQSVFAKSLETNLESGEKIIIAIIL